MPKGAIIEVGGVKVDKHIKLETYLDKNGKQINQKVQLKLIYDSF